jgi:hypothetical protein
MRLKLGLLACLIVLGITTVLSHDGRTRPFREEETMFLVETGSALGGLAISIALIATI